MYTFFSPTKVRIAFECPRLFYLTHHFKSKALFLPHNKLPSIGIKFHKLAEECINLAKKETQFSELFNLPISQLNELKIAAQMQELFYNLLFFPTYLQSAKSENITTLNLLWQGLLNLIPSWVKILIINRNFCQANKVINNTFLDQELSLKYKFNFSNQTQSEIRGRLDILWFDWEKNRFCIIDYKTYQPIDTSAHLAQVALYSYMLTEAKKIPTDAGIYSIFPKFKELYYPWELLTETVQKIIPLKLQQMQLWINWKQGENNPPPKTSQPHLCDICPQKNKCQSFFV